MNAAQIQLHHGECINLQIGFDAHEQSQFSLMCSVASAEELIGPVSIMCCVRVIRPSCQDIEHNVNDSSAFNRAMRLYQIDNNNVRMSERQQQRMEKDTKLIKFNYSSWHSERERNGGKMLIHFFRTIRIDFLPFHLEKRSSLFIANNGNFNPRRMFVVTQRGRRRLLSCCRDFSPFFTILSLPHIQLTQWQSRRWNEKKILKESEKIRKAEWKNHKFNLIFPNDH